MSRIGLKPIVIPAGVEVTISDANTVTVKGPNGTLTQDVNPNITVTIEGSEITLSRPNDNKDNRAMHGLYRALIANMVTGVTEGFKKNLEVNGVTLAQASTVEKDFANYGGNVEAAKAVGKTLAERATAKGIKECVFDRGGYVYHGRVAALADGAREGGLEF